MEVTAVSVELADGPHEASAPVEWRPALTSPFREGTVGVGPVVLEVTTTPLGSGRRVDISVGARPGWRSPNGGPAVSAVCLRLDARPRLVLEHGWQSWSPVGPREVGPVARAVPARRFVPRWARATLSASASAAGRVLCGDQFLLMADGCGPGGADGGVAAWLDGRRHLSTVVATPAGVWMVALLDGVRVGEGWALDPVWLASGDPGPLYSEMAAHWGDVAGARRTGSNPFGWCSWYQYFWKLEGRHVVANAELAGAHGFDLLQVDDGYQAAVGDWLGHRGSFDAHPPATLPGFIEARGMTPGIWTAPFLVVPKSEVARRHPEWVKRAPATSSGRPGRRLPAMFNPPAWGGWAYALDLARPDVLDHLRATFGDLAAQGWRYFKIDFCYAGARGGPPREGPGSNRTRGQILRAGLEAVREGIGDDAVLLGCGCPLAQAVGVVDAMRVSPDTAPRWSPGLLATPGYRDVAPSALAALRTSVLRAPLHRRLWQNDPDCLLLRPTSTRLNEAQRRIEAAVVAGTGAFVIVSDDLATYGQPEWDLLEQVRALVPAGDGPLDLEDPFSAVWRVRSPGGLVLEAHLPAAGAGGGAGGGGGGAGGRRRGGGTGPVPGGDGSWAIAGEATWRGRRSWARAAVVAGADGGAADGGGRSRPPARRGR